MFKKGVPTHREFKVRRVDPPPIPAQPEGTDVFVAGIRPPFIPSDEDGDVAAARKAHFVCPLFNQSAAHVEGSILGWACSSGVLDAQAISLGIPFSTVPENVVAVAAGVATDAVVDKSSGAVAAGDGKPVYDPFPYARDDEKVESKDKDKDKDTTATVECEDDDDYYCGPITNRWQMRRLVVAGDEILCTDAFNAGAAGLPKSRNPAWPCADVLAAHKRGWSEPDRQTGYGVLRLRSSRVGSGERVVDVKGVFPLAVGNERAPPLELYKCYLSIVLTGGYNNMYHLGPGARSILRPDGPARFPRNFAVFSATLLFELLFDAATAITREHRMCRNMTPIVGGQTYRTLFNTGRVVVTVHRLQEEHPKLREAALNLVLQTVVDPLTPGPCSPDGETVSPHSLCAAVMLAGLPWAAARVAIVARMFGQFAAKDTGAYDGTASSLVAPNMRPIRGVLAMKQLLTGDRFGDRSQEFPDDHINKYFASVVTLASLPADIVQVWRQLDMASEVATDEEIRQQADAFVAALVKDLRDRGVIKSTPTTASAAGDEPVEEEKTEETPEEVAATTASPASSGSSSGSGAGSGSGPSELDGEPRTLRGIAGDKAPVTAAVKSFVKGMLASTAPKNGDGYGMSTASTPAASTNPELHKPESRPWLPANSIHPYTTTCGFCFAEFPSKRQMFQHLVRMGHLPAKKRNRGNRPERTHMYAALGIKCVVCRDRFNSEEDLVRHYNSSQTSPCFRGGGTTPLPPEELATLSAPSTSTSRKAPIAATQCVSCEHHIGVTSGVSTTATPATTTMAAPHAGAGAGSSDPPSNNDLEAVPSNDPASSSTSSGVADAPWANPNARYFVPCGHFCCGSCPATTVCPKCPDSSGLQSQAHDNAA